MKQKLAVLILSGMLSGLTACGELAGGPPAPSPEPEVSTAPPPVQAAEETPDPVPEESTGTVHYYESGTGDAACSSREIFLAESGFWGEPPLCEFRMEQEQNVYEEGELTGTVLQTLHMDLYYNEETGGGCGLWYCEVPGEDPYIQGFRFAETTGGDDNTWHQWDRWEMDYFSIPDFEAGGVEDYQEHYEYGEDGRIISFLADGIYETPWETGQERNPVYQASFIYDEGGNLQCREFFQAAFGTSGMSQRSYFDGLGRVCYEWSYITHGNLEYYYIYEGDSPEPAYCLFLDHDIGPIIRAEFARY